MTRIERAFLTPAGLPGRNWFKHAIFAPGLTIGYGCWPLPGPYQAIVEEDPKLLGEQLPILVRQINTAAQALVEAARLAGEAVK